MTDNTHHCPICAEPFMADTPAQVALDEREETPAEEFSRLVIEYNEGEESERDEAWNLIADFACEHADTIVRALSSVYAGDDGQGALVERLQAQLRKAAGEMREEGHKGWPVTCDDAADRIEALTRENATLRADKERLERERNYYKELLSASDADRLAAERRLAEQGQAQGEAGELSAICAVVGCQEKPGVALRFVKELRRDLQRAHERHIELLRTWEDASLTERQELDRLRRGWGPSTPTERMARRTDLQAAMRTLESAMDAVLPDDKKDEDLTRNHFQAAYDKLSDGHREIIALLHALPELSAPDLLATPPSPEPDALHDFKNFHRNLCKRFDYCHDDKDWQRDQVSLIEHIARKVSPEPDAELARKEAVDLAERAGIDMLDDHDEFITDLTETLVRFARHRKQGGA